MESFKYVPRSFNKQYRSSETRSRMRHMYSIVASCQATMQTINLAAVLIV